MVQYNNNSGRIRYLFIVCNVKNPTANSIALWKPCLALLYTSITIFSSLKTEIETTPETWLGGGETKP